MLASVRAATIAALVAVASVTSGFAADKAYVRDDLADAAIKVEGEIKKEAGTVAKPLATLRREADTAIERRDIRAALQVMAQIIAVEPNESVNWLRLARTVLQVTPRDDRDRVA